mmetsp:Transcript_7799/g.18316  ORF Transcript_7799/g.18316 Transcript_7799/m.18316 type:complete len:218 (+) Transcript_7799:879-1532(+)
MGRLLHRGGARALGPRGHPYLRHGHGYLHAVQPLREGCHPDDARVQGRRRHSRDLRLRLPRHGHGVLPHPVAHLVAQPPRLRPPSLLRRPAAHPHRLRAHELLPRPRLVAAPHQLGLPVHHVVVGAARRGRLRPRRQDLLRQQLPRQVRRRRRARGVRPQQCDERLGSYPADDHAHRRPDHLRLRGQHHLPRAQGQRDGDRERRGRQVGRVDSEQRA